MPSGMTCIEAPLRVHRVHVRRPQHSPQRTVSDDRRRGKHDEDCSVSNCDGGLGLRRGCDRRMRSSSLARSRDVPCSGRRKRHIRISETSTQISTRTISKSALLGGCPSGGGLSRRESFHCTHSGFDLHGHLLVALPSHRRGGAVHSGSAIAFRDVPAAASHGTTSFWALPGQ